jgi:predicted dehydrogenase
LTQKVRIAFVGLGWWSGMLATAAAASARTSIAACVSRSAPKRDAFVAEFGGYAAESLDDVLTDPDIDAVVLTTPNSVHAEQCIAAARHGKHIFIEKPMALTTADCRLMIAETERAGVVLAIGLNKRRMSAYRKVREIIESGGVGEIMMIEAHSSGSFGLTATPDKWRWYRNESPGGPLTTHTIHHIDVLNLLLGSPVRISAFASKVHGNMEADELVSACLQYDSGALGYLGGSFMSPSRKYFNLLGTNGLIYVDEDTGTLSHKKDGGDAFDIVEIKPPGEQTRASLAEEMDEFAACIQDGLKPEVGGREGMNAVAVIEAIVQSSEAGEAIGLNASETE